MLRAGLDSRRKKTLKGILAAQLSRKVRLFETFLQGKTTKSTPTAPAPAWNPTTMETKSFLDQEAEVAVEYTQRDLLLYAVGLGCTDIK
jgi:hypothetical protein